MIFLLWIVILFTNILKWPVSELKEYGLIEAVRLAVHIVLIIDIMICIKIKAKLLEKEVFQIS